MENKTNFNKKCYEMYKLQWMLSHDFSLTDRREAAPMPDFKVPAPKKATRRAPVRKSPAAAAAAPAPAPRKKTVKKK